MDGFFFPMAIEEIFALDNWAEGSSSRAGKPNAVGDGMGVMKRLRDFAGRALCSVIWQEILLT